MAVLNTSKLILSLSKQNGLPAIGVALCGKRNQSNIAAYKRGTGGRSSFSGIVATVLGASGFMGKYVVNRLGKIGSQIIIPYRGEPYFLKDLKLAGDLGQVLFLPYDIRDEESLRKVMQYSNVVVNMVGRDWETKNFSFASVHTDGARRIARIAKEMGVEKFIHFSHLNASPNPQAVYIKGGSKYLKSKYYGEEAVKREFPEAIIFRPSDIWGLEDRFIRYYSNHWRRNLGTIPLYKRGTQTVKAPVFCSNVAEGVINAIRDPEANGKTFDCIGPHSYNQGELIDFFLRCMRRDGMLRRGYVTPMFRAKVSYMGKFMPSYPILNWEKLERESVSDVLTGRNPTLEDLGVKLTRIEDRAPWELMPFKAHPYYEEKVGEFPDPTPPPVLS